MSSTTFTPLAGELPALDIDVIDQDPRKNGLGWTDLSDPEGTVRVSSVLLSSARLEDYAQLFWNDVVVAQFRLDASHLSTASMTFQVPVSVIQDSPPDAQVYGQLTTSVGEQASTSPVRSVLVKRKIPGGFDPDHTTPYNDNLAAPLGVPPDIEEAEDLLLTVQPWLNMAVGDVLTLFWGNSQYRVTMPPITAAQVGQNQAVRVPAALQVLAGDSARLLVDYEVRDVVNNWSKYSLPAFTNVQVDPAAPAAPRVLEAVDNVLNLADLAGNNATVRLPGSLVVAVGDIITLDWQGRSADGSPVVPVIAPMVVGDPDFLADFSVPYSAAAAIAMGSVRVSYTVTQGVTLHRSKSLTISVIGEVVHLLPPMVSEAGGGVLDPGVVGPVGAHVVLAPYTGMATGDQLLLTWEGTTQSGVIQLYTDDKPVTQNMVGLPVTFVVPLAWVSILAGGSLKVSYQVRVAGGALLPSDVLALRVSGAQALLPVPSVDFVVGGLLDPATPATVVRIPVYIGKGQGETVIVHWDGVPTGTTTDQTLVNSASQTVSFDIAERFISANLGTTVTVWYEVIWANGTAQSERFQFAVSEAVVVPVLPAPSIVGVIGGVLDPAFNGGIATVQVDYQNEQNGDVVALIWNGGVTGDYGAEQIAVTNVPLTFSVPSAQVTPNAGNRITVSYSVSRAFADGTPAGAWVSLSSVFSVLSSAELPGGDQPLSAPALEQPFFPPEGGEPANYLGAYNRVQGLNGIWLDIPVTYLNWALNDMIEWQFTGKNGLVGDGDDVPGGATSGTHFLDPADVTLGYHRAFIGPAFLFAVCEGSAALKYSVTNSAGKNSSGTYVVGLYIRDWSGCIWPIPGRWPTFQSARLATDFLHGMPSVDVKHSASPSAVRGLTIAVIDHGGRAGLNLADLDAPSGTVLLSTVMPLTAQVGDYAELYWGAAFAEKITLTTSHLASRILLFHLPVALIATDSPPDIEAYYISYAGPFHNASESARRAVLVKRSMPGGFDPNNTTPGVNENLKPVVGLPAHIDRPVDLTLSIPVWQNMHEGDVLSVYWGNSLTKVNSPPITLAQVGQPQSVVVSAALQVDAGSNLTLKVYYEVYDPVLNWSMYSIPAFTDAQVDPNSPAAPRVVEADPTSQVIDLAILGEALVHVQLPRSVVLAVGDLVTLSWQGLPADGSLLAPFVASFTVNDVNILPLFEVPNSFAAELSGGTARVFYTTTGSLAQHSKSVTVQVVGVVATLRAPSVLEAIGSQLNPQDTPLGATVVIDPYTVMATGQKVLLTWIGQLPGGTPREYHAELIVLRSQVGQPLWFTVPAEWVVGFAGGQVSVSYRVDRFTGTLLNSRLLDLSVIASSALLPAPFVDREFGGLLDPYPLGSSTQAHVLPYSGKGGGETLILHWFGAAGAGSFTDSTVVHELQQPLVFAVTNAVIEANLDRDVRVGYEVRRLDGSVENSATLDFKVGTLELVLPAPDVVEAPTGVLDPLNALSGATVRVKYLMRTSDTVGIFWDGRTDYPEQAGSASRELDFRVPSEHIGRALGKTIDVLYATTRDGVAKASDVLALKVNPLPLSALEGPMITQALNNVLDIDALTEDADLTVKAWPFITLGQYVWLRLEGINADGTASSWLHPVWQQYGITTVGMQSTKVALSYLGRLRDGSSLKLIFEVSFDGGDVRMAFPLTTLTVKVTEAVPVINRVVGALGEVANGGNTKDTTLTLHGTATANRQVAIFDGGGSRITVDVSPASVWQATVGGLALGNHSMTARTVAGVRVSDPWAFIVQASEPPFVVNPAAISLTGKLFAPYGWSGPEPLHWPANTTSARTPTGGTPPYTYVSSNPAVVRVNGSGQIFSRGNGSATITVRDSTGHSGSYNVTVGNVVPCYGLDSQNYPPATRIAAAQGLHIPNMAELRSMYSMFGST